jgi:hypothetical protein
MPYTAMRTRPMPVASEDLVAIAPILPTRGCAHDLRRQFSANQIWYIR